MHSSRMRTGRSLTVCRSLLPGGVSALGGVCSGGGLPGQGGGWYPSMHWGRPHLWTKWMTDRCKNITLATTSLQLVTSMHSSRMCTIRNSSHLQGGSLLTETPFQPEGHNRRPPQGLTRRPPHHKASPEGHTKAILVWPSGMAFWCGGLLLWPSGWMDSLLGDTPSTRRPYQKAITEDHFQPEGHQTRPYQKATPQSRHPLKAIAEDHFQPGDCLQSEGHQTRRP